MTLLQKPPLGLYVHIPWCVQKCPYCDFNSHGVKQAIPESTYVTHLLDDLQQDAALVTGRPISSIFIGGGTPSLFSADAIAHLLHGIKQRVALTTDAEITLEANPGTLDESRFAGFQQAGVNRFSIGVQSFQTPQLQALGRIHDHHQAISAAQAVAKLPLKGFNLDLMHGLPAQTLSAALADLQQAIDLQPPHLSWYQLTIEPNTQFHSRPPILPEDEVLWDIQEQGQQQLAQAGYQQYEVSGYAKPGYQCQHNLNYWRFGDYLGIGCGAHGKITTDTDIFRTTKVKHPKGYMELTRPYIDKQWSVPVEDRPFEFMMNRLRLNEPCPMEDFSRYTGLPLSHIDALITEAETKGLLRVDAAQWQTTELGRRYLNSLLDLFL